MSIRSTITRSLKLQEGMWDTSDPDTWKAQHSIASKQPQSSLPAAPAPQERENYDFVARKSISHPLFRQDTQGRLFFYNGTQGNREPMYIRPENDKTQTLVGSFGTPVHASSEDHQRLLLHHVGFKKGQYGARGPNESVATTIYHDFYGSRTGISNRIPVCPICGLPTNDDFYGNRGSDASLRDGKRCQCNKIAQETAEQTHGES